MKKYLLFPALTLGVVAAFGQTRPSFEVATIKLTDPSFGGIVAGFPPGRFETRGFTLKDLVGMAYPVDNRQIADGPKWAESERYDVVGTTAGKDTPDEIMLMVQTLLADRFQLKFHHGTKDVPAYALTVANGGPKMKVRTEGDGGALDSMLIWGTLIPGRDVTVQFLAAGLQNILDRPVLDETGLTAHYDFDLKWRDEPTPLGGHGDQVSGDSNDPDLFTAIQEQLGLKLTAEKAPVYSVVIESAEKPLGN